MSKKKRIPDRAATTCAANRTAATNGAANGTAENVSTNGVSSENTPSSENASSPENATAIVPAGGAIGGAVVSSDEFASVNAAAIPTSTEPDPTDPTDPTDPVAAEDTVVAALVATLDAVTELTESRTRQHLSTLRLRGVARELRELVKVMSVYSL